MKYIYCFILISAAFVSCSNRPVPGDRDTESWAVRIADAVIHRNDSLIYYAPYDKPKWRYDVAMLGQAIDKLGVIDTVYSRYFEDYMNYFVQDNGKILTYKLSDYSLDNVNPAKGLITLYKRTGEEKYLIAINQIIKQLTEQPRTHSGGFWHKKIYPWQMWLDGIYMSSPFLAQYAQEFNKPAWFDTVSRQITLIYSKTYDPVTGLLYHAWDESKSQQWCNPETGQSKVFWGRAVGWYMMALADVLDYLPVDYGYRDSVITLFNNTAQALLKVRDSETKMWYQVLDKAGQPGNYPESSCSAMLAYAFAKGVKKDYLPAKFLDIARETFHSIIEIDVVEGEDGYPVLKNTCGGAGLGGNPYRDGTYEYYINEKRVDNDPKGLGPLILAALELNE